jgi:glycosyltransferase involved in cell wall biosynthesis
MSLCVGFDATAAVHQAAGIGRYTRHLLGALARCDSDERYRLYYCARGPRSGGLPPLSSRFHVQPAPVSDRVMNLAWHRARLPLPVQLFTGHFDVFHSPDFTLPPTWRRAAVLTVHDLAFLTVPDCAYPTLRSYLQEVVPRSARRATRIIAVSESTRRDVINLLGIPEDRVTTVPEAAGEHFSPPKDRVEARQVVSGLGVSQPFLLSVGTLEPRKNYTRLFEAYGQLRHQGYLHQLVVAGKPGWLFEPSLQRLRELHLDAHVTFVEPNDAQLAALYSLADVFVYQSLYEGFGIPPLEAMACGAAVACSDSSSLPEVVGDSAVTFDPHDVDAIASAVGSILDDPVLQSRLRTKGLQRAALFSWKRAAHQTIRVYREAAGA